MDRFIRLDQLNHAGLDDDEKIDALTLAVSELPVMMEMAFTHTPSRFRRVYQEQGGRLRFDGDGMLMVPVPEAEPVTKTRFAEDLAVIAAVACPFCGARRHQWCQIVNAAGTPIRKSVHVHSTRLKAYEDARAKDSAAERGEN